MDEESQNRVFADPVQTYLDSAKQKWKPNNRVQSIIPTYKNENIEFNPKRPRQEIEHQNTSQQTKVTRITKNSSYSSITAGKSGSQIQNNNTKMEQ
jgi:hypothetical protein